MIGASVDLPPVVVGIDPGKSGAAVALDLHGRAVEWIAADHPDEGYTVKARGGALYVPSCMALWIHDLAQSHKIVQVVIEKQQARPMEGRSSVLTTGYGFGLWVGILAALRVRHKIEPAATWTRAVFGAKPRTDERKARAITTAAAQVPDLPLTWGRKTKPHDGLADAACMALHALQLVPKGVAA